MNISSILVSVLTSWSAFAVTPGATAPAQVCEALRLATPLEAHSATEKMAFEVGDIAPVCKPFVKLARKDLDRCGDVKKDPYTSTTSLFTWSSRTEMSQRGKTNIFTDPELRPQVPAIQHRLAALKDSAAELCCGGDVACKQSFDRVEVSFCQPQADPNAPDPCVFGGSYKMSGAGYSAIFQAIARVHGEAEASEFRKISERNLTPAETHTDAHSEAHAASGTITSGRIVLSSYVPKTTGAAAIEPILLHEFGHACSMIRMQQWSLDPGSAGVSAAAPVKEAAKESTQRALRAARWLDSARSRCNPDLQLPEAYNDFWASLGESHELAQCLYRLTTVNQKQQVDHTCPGLCPGHYLEESVGVAFSLLLGGVSTDLSPNPAAVFPATCDHVRDGQHPMVSDVVDCLTQHSSRFREKLRLAYRCQ